MKLVDTCVCAASHRKQTPVPCDPRPSRALRLPGGTLACARALLPTATPVSCGPHGCRAAGIPASQVRRRGSRGWAACPRSTGAGFLPKTWPLTLCSLRSTGRVGGEAAVPERRGTGTPRRETQRGGSPGTAHTRDWNGALWAEKRGNSVVWVGRLLHRAQVHGPQENPAGGGRPRPAPETASLASDDDTGLGRGHCECAHTALPMTRPQSPKDSPEKGYGDTEGGGENRCWRGGGEIRPGALLGNGKSCSCCGDQHGLVVQPSPFWASPRRRQTSRDVPTLSTAAGGGRSPRVRE